MKKTNISQFIKDFLSQFSKKNHEKKKHLIHRIQTAAESTGLLGKIIEGGSWEHPNVIWDAIRSMKEADEDNIALRINKVYYVGGGGVDACPFSKRYAFVVTASTTNTITVQGKLDCVAYGTYEWPFSKYKMHLVVC